MFLFHAEPLSYIFSSHNGARFPNPSERPTSIRFNFILNPTRFLIRSIRRAPSTSKSPQSFFSETELRSVLIHSDLLRNPPRPLISFGASWLQNIPLHFENWLINHRVSDFSSRKLYRTHESFILSSPLSPWEQRDALRKALKSCGNDVYPYACCSRRGSEDGERYARLLRDPARTRATLQDCTYAATYRPL